MTADADAGADTGADEARRSSLASGILGLLMIVAAAVVLADAAGLRGSDDALGPAAAPLLIGVLLGLLGGALAVRARHVLRRPEVRAGRLWRLGTMVLLLIAFAVLLPFLGYVVSSAGLFTGAALLLGAPRPARVVAYGWTLAALAFIVFDQIIGLTLPAGPWGF